MILYGGRGGGGSRQELWRSFIVHHKGGTMLPWTWTETEDAMICPQKWPQRRRIYQLNCPWHSLNKMIGLKWQSVEIRQLFTVWVNKTQREIGWNMAIPGLTMITRHFGIQQIWNLISFLWLYRSKHDTKTVGYDYSWSRFVYWHWLFF